MYAVLPETVLLKEGKTMKTTTWISVMVALVALPAVAAEVASTARVGVPIQHHRGIVRGGIDPADLGSMQTPRDLGDPILEVEMDKLVYELGETPTITVRMKRADHSGVENADVAADTDDKRQHRLTHRGKGEYTGALDNTPGEHSVVVNADAVVNGNSVHRAVAYSYEVATGHLQVLGLGPTRQDATYLYVPLTLRCTANGFYRFQGTLVNTDTVVAYSETSAGLMPGREAGIEMRFALADLVEPG
ncbi:MAG: hypothetical protein ACRDL7_11020, partial [Gaiellaceae bacterium]